MPEFDNINESKAKKAFDWFLKTIKKSVSDKAEDIDAEDANNIQDVIDKVRIFNMYTTIYSDPKYKKELPFYDAMPLFFPIDIVNGSEGPLLRAFNIHYLPPALRYKFIMELKSVIEKAALAQKYDINQLSKYPHQNITKVVGRYMNNVYLMGGGSSGEMIRQCYRSYFFGRMKGRLKFIPLKDWENSVNLILPVFRKASNKEVYDEIRRQYNKYKNNPRSPVF